MSNIGRLESRQKTEERKTSRVGINLAKTRQGHPYIALVDVSVRFYQCGKYRPVVISSSKIGGHR